MTKFLTTAAVLALATGAAQAEFELTILHTNDYHDRHEPISAYDGPCGAEDDAAGACFGGTARLTSAIRDARARAGDTPTLLVDGGDQFLGTLFYTQYKGAVAAEMMNRLGYDAMTVGNHEFDDGPEVLAEFVEAVDFPILMSNADVSDEPLLAEKIMPSTVIEKGGERIGLIGLTPQDTDELASPGPNITFTDPSEAVQAEIDRLAAEGVNKIVVLSHSGYEVDKRVAESTTGVDVIVGGHSNTLLGDFEDAAGPYPTVVGRRAHRAGLRLRQVSGRAARHIRRRGGGRRGVRPAAPDRRVRRGGRGRARPRPRAGRPARGDPGPRGGADGHADRGRPRGMSVPECSMGSLIAEAMLERVAEQGIDVAIMNGGGIRASIDAGPITMGEVMTVLPFQNTLSTFEVTGATLLEALENGVSQVEEGAGRFPQVAGMSFAYDPSAEPGARVSDVMVGGEPLDPEAIYGVVSNNYVRTGGDGYAMFEDAARAYDFGPDLADVTAEYIAARGAGFEPATDGRIVVK